MSEYGPIKKKSSTILYIGKDHHLFYLLQSYFANALGNGTTLEILDYKSSQGIQALSIKVNSIRPKLIIIDLSVDTTQMLHLIRIMERMDFQPKTQVIGVTDATQSGSIVKEAIMAGVNSIHVKSGEIDGLGFNCVALAFADKAKEHPFVKAKMNDTTECFVPAKISIVDSESITVESNFKTTQSNFYFFKSEFSKKKITVSTLMQCKSTWSSNLYYNYSYGHQLLWPAISDDAQEQEAVESMPTEDDFDEQNRLIGKWINGQSSSSKPKSAKALVIDNELKLLGSDRLTDTFKYVVRCQPYLFNAAKALTKINPQIIFFEHELLEEDVEAESEIFFNNCDALKRLVGAIKSKDNYEPYIIVSNIDTSTDDLQKRLSYLNIISYTQPISPDLVNLITRKLQLKIDSHSLKTPGVILDKVHPCSYSEFIIDIEINTLSELDVHFTSSENFDIGTNIRIKSPVPMFISIAPDPKGSKEQGVYYGLINAIRAEDQMALRRHINSVFFREKEAARAAEQEEIEAKKVEFLRAKEKAIEEEKIKAKEKAIEEEKKKKTEENES